MTSGKSGLMCSTLKMLISVLSNKAVLGLINCSPEVHDIGIRSKTMDGLEDEEFDVSLTREAQRASRELLL